jgi:hypothetical protein
MVSLAEHNSTLSFMLSLTPDECYVNHLTNKHCLTLVSDKSCEQSTWTRAKWSKRRVKTCIMDSLLVYSDPETGVASLSKISLFIKQHSILSQSTWILIITALRIWNLTSCTHGEMRNSYKILVGERANMWPFWKKLNGRLIFKWLGKRCSGRILWTC